MQYAVNKLWRKKQHSTTASAIVELVTVMYLRNSSARHSRVVYTRCEELQPFTGFNSAAALSLADNFIFFCDSKINFTFSTDSSTNLPCLFSLGLSYLLVCDPQNLPLVSTSYTQPTTALHFCVLTQGETTLNKRSSHTLQIANADLKTRSTTKNPATIFKQ